MQDKQQKIPGKISALAHKKIVYHMLRYPTSKVYGVLVGKPHNALDAYPLSHTPLVNPTLSVALDLIQSNLEEEYSIIGFYQSAQGGNLKMSSLIENNQALKNSMAVRGWMNQEGGISLGAKGYQLDYPGFGVLRQELDRGEYRFVVDFDAHFEEIELDFTNRHIK